MPGAGSLRATNYIYNVAPKDGTAFAMFSSSMPVRSILGGNKSVQFDSLKLTWLGSSSSFAGDAYLLVIRADAPLLHRDSDFDVLARHSDLQIHSWR